MRSLVNFCLTKLPLFLQLHIVHAKTSDLKDLNELLENSSDALAVLGILIDVGRGSESNSNEGTNYDIQMLFDTINELQYKGIIYLN